MERIFEGGTSSGSSAAAHIIGDAAVEPWDATAPRGGTVYQLVL